MDWPIELAEWRENFWKHGGKRVTWFPFFFGKQWNFRLDEPMGNGRVQTVGSRKTSCNVQRLLPTYYANLPPFISNNYAEKEKQSSLKIQTCRWIFLRNKKPNTCSALVTSPASKKGGRNWKDLFREAAIEVEKCVFDQLPPVFPEIMTFEFRSFSRADLKDDVIKCRKKKKSKMKIIKLVNIQKRIQITGMHLNILPSRLFWLLPEMWESGAWRHGKL